MAYTTTSKFVQLTPYLLMEYMYASSPTPETYFTNSGGTPVGYNKMVNGYKGNSVQVYNLDSNFPITHNTSQNSVVSISENSFVTLNSNLITPFNEYSDKLTKSNDLPVNFLYNLSVVYDTVRYHLRAGYVFQNIDGAILSIEYQDANSSYVTFSQIILRKGTDQDYVLNPNPVTIGADIYDKYFEIKIPSLKNMNDTYIATAPSFQSQSLGALLSASGRGFYINAPMRISLWQIQSIDTYVGYERYNCARAALLSLEQLDPFGNIGAVIQESQQGQFFEYFATDEEGFVEDFILFQNSIGNSYYINHSIEVLEQIGAALIETTRFESVQTSAYDTPNYYRPIVRNAAFSSAFTLRYTMTLVNNKDQSRTVRIATYTSTDPGKWGTTITPIQLNKNPQALKIYNRVYSQPQINIGSSNELQPKEVFKFSNVYIQQNYVTSSTTSLALQDGVLVEDNGTSQNIALGSGKLAITISPFDNYYKFKFLKGGTDGNPVAVDLSSSSYYICFIDNNGKKNYIPAILDTTLASPSSGEIAFKVDETNSSKIILFEDDRFFITIGAGTSVGATAGSNLIGVAGADPVNDLARASQSSGSNVMYWGYWKENGDRDPEVTVNAMSEANSLANPQVITIKQSGTQSVTQGSPNGTGMTTSIEQTPTQTQTGVAPQPIVLFENIGSGVNSEGEIEPIALKPPKPVVQTIRPAYVPSTVTVSTDGGNVEAIPNE
jgi:hypothetical protein